MTADDKCDGCGRRGVELHGLDLLDGGDTFAVCIPCLGDAIKTCGNVKVFELVES